MKKFTQRDKISSLFDKAKCSSATPFEFEQSQKASSNSQGYSSIQSKTDEEQKEVKFSISKNSKSKQKSLKMSEFTIESDLITSEEEVILQAQRACSTSSKDSIHTSESCGDGSYNSSSISGSPQSKYNSSSSYTENSSKYRSTSSEYQSSSYTSDGGMTVDELMHIRIRRR
ncbi:unnamed protein product [Moneuplotes crassus]|uniref:Uncharacterized protein n=1 Tax=Euplotes crassus TaxID=5936 RepID=A0AAD2D3C7_EUPCR|nr:unnamed protein product [Moneuplotes crassus]